MKTDAGPGRLSLAAESLDFCEEMHQKGIFIMLSLPNGTEVQVECDQMYSSFKPRCKASAIHVVGKKMSARLAARQAFAETQNCDSDDLASISDSSISDDGSIRKKKGPSIGNVSLTKRDLANIVDGDPGDPLDLRPFSFCFTKEKICGLKLV